MDRPILFSGSMVRALLDDRKTQTRRVLTPAPRDPFKLPSGEWRDYDGLCEKPLAGVKFTVGDRLWVRESIGRRTASFMGIEATNGVEEAFYVADDEPVLNEHEFNLCPWWKSKQALPSIHMPRWASRLTLTVNDVRVQRLQEIRDDDAYAEGWPGNARDGAWLPNSERRPDDISDVFHWYRDLWDKLNVKRGFGWEANPWIVAVTFTVERRNIDAGAA